jgi:hypothetical protein
MNPTRRAALSVFVIATFAALFFAPELFGDRRVSTANMARWLPWAASASAEERAGPSHNPDCNLSYYPRRAVMHDAWKDGVLPYWNPYSFCGAPFLADPQVGVFYPANWLLVPFDPGRQLGYFLFLHVAWGGIGVWLLARRFTTNAAVAVAAGCAFAVNGYFAKHFGQPVFLAGAAWVPWLLALGLALFDRPTWRRAAVLGGAGALTFLAGQPQTAFHAAYAVALVLAVTWFVRRSAERPRVVRLFAMLAVAVCVAGLLASVQLLPTLDLVQRSARASLPLQTVLSGSFHPVDAIRFVIPEFFGTPLTGDEWSMWFPRGDGFYPRNQLNSIFAGAPVFLLAVWGMVGPRTRRSALPFTALFAVSALVAFGSPLAALAYDWLPGFRFSRIDRIGALVVAAQFVPAVLGARDLASGSGGVGRRRYGMAWIAFAAIVLATVLLRGSSLPQILGSPLASSPGAALDPVRTQLLTTRTIAALVSASVAAIAFLLPARSWSFALPLGAALVQLVLFASPYRTDRRPEEVFRETPSIERLADLLDRDPSQGGYRFVRFGRDLPVQPYPLSSVLPPSTNAPFHLRDLQGYNALADRALGEALETALDENVFSHGIWSGRRIVAPTRLESLQHPLLAALSVGVTVSGRPFDAPG